MTFTETPFWILTAIVFLLWLFCRKNYNAMGTLLLVASLVFYGYHCWWLLILILTYCLIDWGVGCLLVRSRCPGWVLAAGLIFNLIILGYWKYTPMLLRTLAQCALALD